MQIITLLKRSHSSWRSNRLLETAARREGSWGGAVGRKWEINSVSVSATVRHIFLLSFHLIKPVEWALVGSYTRPSKMEVYHCWPFDHQSPCEQIWRNWLDRLINRQGGEIFACFFFVRLRLCRWSVGWGEWWLGSLKHSNPNACRQGWIDRSPGGGWMMKSMAGYHRLLFSGRILHTLYPLFVCFLF